MSVRLQDPIITAKQEAELLKQYSEAVFNGAIDRVLRDCPFIDGPTLMSGLLAFHRERMLKIPSVEKYPEVQPWVDYVLSVDHELLALTGLSDERMAVYRSLGAYLTFRGYAHAKPKQAEKCRVLFVPETDRGALHGKNVDDPITYYKPNPKPEYSCAEIPLVWDGVGSGLHIDDEPEEIFPLPFRDMCFTYCDDVPGAVDFLTRYKYFWGGQNVVLFDRKMRSAAIEKTSYNFIEVFNPGPHGESHVSGMVSRDPNSPQGKYVKAKRSQYLKMFGQPETGLDQVFWNACDTAEQMLADFISKPGQVKIQDVITLFTTPWPKGLNKPGIKLVPNQEVVEYTLITYLALLDERKYFCWQRSEEGVYPDEPFVNEF